jgi:glycosyltransferase involved in cell wall biosynthesis
MQQDRIDVLFLILDLGLTIENSTVFQAQVVDQVIALKKLGYTTAVLCVVNDRKKFQVTAGDKLEQYEIPVFLLTDQGVLKNIFRFAAALNRIRSTQLLGSIYIRGFWAAFPIVLASPIRRLAYVYDVRGDIIDESKARGRKGYRLFLIHKLEAFALRRAVNVTCVTKKLAAIVQARAGLKTLPEVIPSCIDLTEFSFSPEQRFARRAELGYTDEDIVLVYSGGMAHYQMLAEMLALWRGLLCLKKIKFLLLLNSDPASLERSVGNLDDFGPRMKVMNLPRSDVFKTLTAGDIGFLLREDRPLNATASPVKFAEYLAAGLAVVSSPGVGDLSDRIIKLKLGVLVKPVLTNPDVVGLAAFILEFKKDRRVVRDRILLTAMQNYAWNAHRNTYKKVYG